MTMRYLAILASAGLMTAGVASAAETRSGVSIPAATNAKRFGAHFVPFKQWKGAQGHHAQSGHHGHTGHHAHSGHHGHHGHHGPKDSHG